MSFSLIAKIWNLIVESNVFNFIFFIVFFVWVFKKVNISAMITNLQQKIVNVIDLAKKEKEQSVVALNSAEDSVKNLENDLKVILDEAEKSAEVMSEKISAETEKQIENIELNSKKVIEAEEKFLTSSLIKIASKNSVENAKNKILNQLVQSPELHEKYINESIDELDRLKF